MKILKKFYRYLLRQVQREFFGFLGGVTTISIITYGEISRKSIQVSSGSLLSTNIINISITTIGIFMLIVLILYFIFKRR